MWDRPKKSSRLASTTAAAKANMTIVSMHFVSGVRAIFSWQKFTKKCRITHATMLQLLRTYTQVRMNVRGKALMKKFATYPGPMLARPF